jgi:teichuronic acid biosynthesis glycosyltransferase TuaG
MQNNPHPKVSIITPCYNSSTFVSNCINSVLSQSFQNWEHIIVDDCSNDESVASIKAYSGVDSRIRLIKHKHNRGAAASRNTAIGKARGRYVAFLDADDMWLPEKLDIQLGLMEKNNWAFCFSDYSIVDADGNIIKDHVGVPYRIDYRGLLKNTVIGCLTVVIDSHKIGDLRMPEELRSGQDYALWYRILRTGMVAYGIDSVMAQYRVVPGSVSYNKVNAARRMWRLYREYENINVLLSSWYFLNYSINAIRKRF